MTMAMHGYACDEYTPRRITYHYTYHYIYHISLPDEGSFLVQRDGRLTLRAEETPTICSLGHGQSRTVALRNRASRCC